MELPLTSMTDGGKQKAEQAVNRVKERGRTNLSGGLLAALQTLYHIKEESAALVESVLLFTDGKANVGIRDQLTITKATKYGTHLPHHQPTYVPTCSHMCPHVYTPTATFTPPCTHMCTHMHSHVPLYIEACWNRSTDRHVSSHLAMGVSMMLICSSA